MKFQDVVIVGTGHAGAQAAMALRQNGFAGSIGMIGRERVPPYERPPLSKEYLAGEKTFERILIRPPSFWAEKNIELILGAEVVAIDPDAQRVQCSSGLAIGYGNLIWAAGGAPRRLACSGAELDGVHGLRGKADVDRIMRDLEAGATDVVVIGGGYIGLEAAAVLIKLGCKVTLIETLDRVLARVTGSEVSRFLEAEHCAHGVTLRLASSVRGIEGENGRIAGVRLADGELLQCEMALVGIGIEPSVGPLADAGVAVSNGVEVDRYCRTNLPRIHAIGDCAAHASDYAGGAIIRLESVQNAHDMSVVAAKDICGKPAPYSAIPWFWSNQYDLKLQTVGLSHGHEATILRGDPAERSFSVIYLKGGKVIALDCVNATKDYVQGRKLVEAGCHIASERLADPDTPLKALL